MDLGPEIYGLSFWHQHVVDIAFPRRGDHIDTQTL